MGRLHADKYFMGLRSVDLQHGFMDTNIRRIRLKQSMMHAARETIAVADSSKFGRTSLVQIAPLDRVAAILTDEGMPAEVADQLRSRGVIVIATRVAISGDDPSALARSNHARLQSSASKQRVHFCVGAKHRREACAGQDSMAMLRPYRGIAPVGKCTSKQLRARHDRGPGSLDK